MSEVGEANDILHLNHKIRQKELSLNVARRRRVWSNVSLAMGPIFGLLLYVIYWIPLISDEVRRAVYFPAIPVAFLFALASFYLKRTPGGIPQGGEGVSGYGNPVAQWFNRLINSDDRRPTEGALELRLAQLRDERKLAVANKDVPSKVRRVAYKEDAYADIDQLRSESRWYRRFNNILQGVVIVGSLAATGVAGLAGQVEIFRWVVLGITFAVGVSSGFMGYYKYKERSFYLQQTADAIESEWEAVEIGVGRYKHIEGEDKCLEEFVAEVHRLKSEQKKRQQNLEQPPESRGAGE
ncbi:SLATT domain-containing protein [Nocardiopsis sp. YSL2]|uniref:SLATT domain-containing protein n=1 Tax=Nocardiopsis sp. YSL2 TaxID=2939492 RepID=UPI0026F45F82|nr:SLATT domain-containing protein [Nocardiopsis sp. YSL2]